MKLIEYLKKLGFNNNPFQFTNADKEVDVLEHYFIQPDYFEDVWGTPENPTSNIIYAPRGGGKTAQRIMIEQRAKKGKEVLAIAYINHDLSEFKKIEEVNIVYHLIFLNRLLLLAFFSRIGDPDFNFTFTFNHKQRQYIYKLSRIYLYNTPASFPAQAINSLKTIDDHGLEILRRLKEPIAAIIKGITTSKGAPVDLGSIELDNALTNTHKDNFVNIIHLLNNVGYKSVYILVDKVDEQHLTGNNPEASFKLIEDLIKDLELLETPNVGFKFFLWDALRDFVAVTARPDRVFSYKLKWTQKQLRLMLQARAKTYSNNKVDNFESLFASKKSLGRVLLFSENSPRDCIRICNRILSEQFKEDPTSNTFSDNVVNRSIEIFCKEKVEELIPNENSRRHLCRVNKVSFTIEELTTAKLADKINSVRNILNPWQVAGYMKKIGLVNRKNAKAVNEYAFQDVRVAYMACAAMGIDEFIEKKVRRCETDNCKKIFYRDFDKKLYPCPDCEINTS